MKQHPPLRSPGQDSTLHLTPYLSAGKADLQFGTAAQKQQQQKITTAEPTLGISVSAQTSKTKDENVQKFHVSTKSATKLWV